MVSVNYLAQALLRSFPYDTARNARIAIEDRISFSNGLIPREVCIPVVQIEPLDVDGNVIGEPVAFVCSRRWYQWRRYSAARNVARKVAASLKGDDVGDPIVHDRTSSLRLKLLRATLP